MKGHKFLKVTGILLIIAAVFYIIAGVFIGGLGALAAGLGAGGGLTASYYLALLVTLAGGICQLIAGIVGVKHSKSSENSRKCVIWGIAVIAFTVLGAVLNTINSAKFDVGSVVTGLVVPALYLYGAILNSKAGDTQTAV